MKKASIKCMKQKFKMINIKLIIIITVFLTVDWQSAVLAAQSKVGPTGSDINATYSPTPKKFNADNKSVYPQEIYLPNEIKPADYRIHTNFTKNTDACASCHATHTAVGENLLQWGTIYDTCMACHDGTVSTTYDVKNGVIGGTNKPTFGGMFGTGQENSYSSHSVRGAVDISFAPGGIIDSSSAAEDNLKWQTPFGCESCHSPHGQGGNARILNPDPNGAAMALYQNNVSKNVPLVSNGDGTYSTLLKGEKTFWIMGYPYEKYSKIYENTIQITPDKYTIDNSNGNYTVIKFDRGYTPTGLLTADFIPAFKVQMKVENYLTEAENVIHERGLNRFCGACHTDYNTESFDHNSDGTPSGSGSNLTGTYSEAYRHQVGFDYSANEAKLYSKNMKLESGRVTCETCHVAHGTNDTYWARTLGTGWGSEQTGSSALKRIPNMGTCEVCHQKGTESSGYPEVTPISGTVEYNQIGAIFVGSAACQKCHQRQYTDWKNTLHSKMVSSNISPEALNSTGTGWKNSQVLKDNQTGQQVTPDMVSLVIGSKWKQRYLIGDKINGYHFLSQQFNLVTKSWEPYGNTADWDKYCISCHVTGYKISSYTENLANNTVLIQHTWQEDNVGCEACHGPGSKHIGNPNAQNIWNPARQTAQAQAKACGYCHSRFLSNLFKAKQGAVLVKRSDMPAPVGETFEPGDNWTAWGLVPGINDSFDPYIIGSANSTNEIELEKMFYPANGSAKYDGSKHHQQYQEFIQSKHFLEGLMGCSSCHGCNKNESREQLRLSSAQTCAQCHGTTMSLDQFMPMLGKTADNVYVRTHTFSKIPTPQPPDAKEPNNP